MLELTCTNCGEKFVYKYTPRVSKTMTRELCRKCYLQRYYKYKRRVKLNGLQKKCCICGTEKTVVLSPIFYPKENKVVTMCANCKIELNNQGELPLRNTKPSKLYPENPQKST
jgi:hypothetical protein